MMLFCCGSGPLARSLGSRAMQVCSHSRWSEPYSYSNVAILTLDKVERKWPIIPWQLRCATDSANYTKTYPITFWESKDAIHVSLEQI
jgi:hypothetical protein